MNILGAAATIVTTKADLQAAVQAYDANPTAAIAKHGAIAGWDVSAITDMSWLFSRLQNFNADISSWDTSRVTSMDDMFDGAAAFNQPLSLDTSRVTSMYNMFDSASAFNQPLSLDTSSVTDMGFMFYSASAFNQPLSFDTSRVTSMRYMFMVRCPRACPDPPALRRPCAPLPCRRRSTPRVSRGPHLCARLTRPFPLGSAHPPCPLPTSC